MENKKETAEACHQILDALLEKNKELPIVSPHLEKIQPWIDFLKEQGNVRILYEEKDFSKMYSNPFPENFSFAVMFPKSFHYLDEFKEKLKYAEAFAVFCKDKSALLSYNTKDFEPLVMDSLDVWKVILLSATGKDTKFLLSLEIDENNIQVKSLLSNKKNKEK